MLLALSQNVLPVDQQMVTGTGVSLSLLPMEQIQKY